MLNRQRRLLALLDALGGRVGNMDSRSCLYCREEDPAPYEFVPYKYGAFSLRHTPTGASSWTEDFSTTRRTSGQSVM